MPTSAPNLLEGKTLTGVLPPDKQPPIQNFLSTYNKAVLVDIEACIDDPSLAPLGRHVTKVKRKSKMRQKPTGQVLIDQQIARANFTNGTVMLRRRGLETIQLASELQQFHNYSTLVELDISRNQLTELPTELSQLTQLKILNVTSNQLTHIPNEIYNLKNLQVLTLSQNKIKVIPEDMPNQMPNLITFRIAANLIHTLPSEIHKWVHMKHLQLGSVYGGNQLSELPDTISDMPHLEELDLSYNQLRQLPTHFKISTLQILNISHNQLDILPLSITNCLQLKSLNLSKNHLTSLPADLINLQKLELLDISENLLCIMPAEVLEKMDSATLLITGNPLARPGNCDQQRSSQDAYTKILRKMMQRGVPRSSPIASPSLSRSTSMTNLNLLREQCGPNGTGCLTPPLSKTSFSFSPTPQHSSSNLPTPSSSSSSSSSSPTTLPKKSVKHEDEPTTSRSAQQSTNDLMIEFESHIPQSQPFQFVHPNEDIDASIDQELSFHAQQLNIDGSRPHKRDLLGTTHSKLAADSNDQCIIVDPQLPLPTETNLLHSLRELATRVILKSKMDVPSEFLPEHLEEDLTKGRSCSFCEGPFINEWVTSVQIKSFAGHPAVVRRVRFCSITCFSRCTATENSKSVVCVHHN